MTSTIANDSNAADGLTGPAGGAHVGPRLHLVFPSPILQFSIHNFQFAISADNFVLESAWVSRTRTTENIESGCISTPISSFPKEWRGRTKEIQKEIKPDKGSIKILKVSKGINANARQ
jgi:hypothetical protein